MTPYERLAEVVRLEGGRVVASLVRTTRDLQLAEDCFQEATLEALAHWPVDGLPPEPRAWLILTARRKALDVLRREARRPHLELRAHEDAPEQQRDDLLSLVFTCCHPALAPDVQVALTLRTICGLTAEEIARVFLVPESTMAKRLTRARTKISGAGIPYRVPEDHELGERLHPVTQTLHALFTSGHGAVTRVDLCREAVRLTRTLTVLMPGEASLQGLLALMLLTEARQPARLDAAGDLVLLPDQDRTLWDRPMVDEGVRLLTESLRRTGGAADVWALQACLAAVHATAPTWGATDWPELLRLYDLLLQAAPNDVVRLNRAVVVAELDGPAAALAEVDGLDLPGLHLWHATRGELLGRLGRDAEARAALEAALECSPSAPERALLHRRIGLLDAGRELA